MGSIRRAPRSGRWEARWRDTAGRQRTARRDASGRPFATKADARAFLSTVEADTLRGIYLDPSGGRVLFVEWAERWWSTTVNLRPSTRARDLSLYRNHIEPVFGRFPLAGIEHLEVREWIANLSASG